MESMRKKFFDIFHRSLWDYYNPWFGFDIIKFDEDFIKSPDNVSMKDVVLNKFGQDAIDLIYELLHQ